MRLSGFFYELSTKRYSIQELMRAIFCGETMNDSRKHTRVDYCRNVTFSVDGIVYNGLSRDFSMGGMFIEVEGPFRLGQQILLSVQSEDHKRQLKFYSRIIRVTDRGIAVRFYTVV